MSVDCRINGRHAASVVYKGKPLDIKGNIGFCNHSITFSDVTWAASQMNSPATLLFVKQLIRADTKENIKARYFWPIVSRVKRRVMDSLANVQQSIKCV